MCQQRSLFYHVGVRESFGMRHTIILYNDSNTEATKLLRSLCSSYDFVSYRCIDEAGGGAHLDKVVVTSSSSRGTAEADEGSLLLTKLQQVLHDAALCTRAHMKEKFLADLRKARELYSGADLKAQLTILRKRLDDPNILSGDVVLAMLLALRDAEDYDTMVQLVNSLQLLPAAQPYTSSVAVIHLLGFALNRRNHGDDRERAERLVREALEREVAEHHDLACLCGRMHKDQYVESGHTDQESLNNAIFWYRKGFEDHPNEYAGINLATLLVIAGNDFAQSSELQHIALLLYNLIGKKGSLDKLEDYWDVATLFEISVLAEDYGKAVQAAEYMFKLKPPNWYLQSTMGNIALIQRARAPLAPEEQSAAQRHFQFWVSFFTAASSKIEDFHAFPVLMMEQTHRPDETVYSPAHISLCGRGGDSALQLHRLHLDTCCSQGQDSVVAAGDIKTIEQHKRDPRTVVVGMGCDVWQVVMPSQHHSARLCRLLQRAQ